MRARARSTYSQRGHVTKQQCLTVRMTYRERKKTRYECVEGRRRESEACEKGNTDERACTNKVDYVRPFRELYDFWGQIVGFCSKQWEERVEYIEYV